MITIVINKIFTSITSTTTTTAIIIIIIIIIKYANS